MSHVHAALDRPAVHRPLAVLTAALLVGVALVHLLDGPGSLSDHAYIGALELALAAASVPLAVLMITCPVRALWLSAAALCASALLVYIASRTVGLPGSSDDIGNWFQTLGIANVLTEVAVIALAVRAVLR